MSVDSVLIDFLNFAVYRGIILPVTLTISVLWIAFIHNICVLIYHLFVYSFIDLFLYLLIYLFIIQYAYIPTLKSLSELYESYMYLYIFVFT